MEEYVSMATQPRQRLMAGLATALVLAGCGPLALAPAVGPAAVSRFDSGRGAANAIYTFFALDNDLDNGDRIAQRLVRAAGSSRSVAAAALYDGEDRNDTTLFIANPGRSANANQIKEVDSGTAAALGSFLSQAISEAPGKRRIVSMADHGGGIVRGICSDWNGPGGKKIIHVNEVAAAMRPTPVDIMMFDACFMNMAEVAFELKDTAKVVIGAQTTTRGDFPYDDLVELVDANSTADTNRLAAAMTKTIAGSASYSGVAFGAVDTARMTTAATSVAKLSKALIAALPQHKAAIKSAIGSATAYAAFPEPGMAMYNQYKDFGSVMANLSRIADPAVQAAAKEAQAAGQASVLASHARSGDGLSLSNVSGVALYASTEGYVEEKYLSKAWNKATGWGDFLVRMNAGGGYANPVQRDKFPFAFPRPRAK
jgi:hypothetical protein